MLTNPPVPYDFSVVGAFSVIVQLHRSIVYSTTDNKGVIEYSRTPSQYAAGVQAGPDQHRRVRGGAAGEAGHGREPRGGQHGAGVRGHCVTRL